MRNTKEADKAAIDAKLIRMLGHPVRVQILHALNQREASPKELAKELDFDLSTLSYHVRLLEKAGYIKLVGLVNGSGRRGGLEHRYIGTEVAEFDNEEWSKIPEQMKNGIVAWQLKETSHLAIEAMRAGTFEHRPDRHHSLIEAIVDEQGWSDAIATLEEAMARLREIEAESTGRIGDSTTGVRIPIAVSMLGFEKAR